MKKNIRKLINHYIYGLYMNIVQVIPITIINTVKNYNLNCQLADTKNNIFFSDILNYYSFNNKTPIVAALIVKINDIEYNNLTYVSVEYIRKSIINYLWTKGYNETKDIPACKNPNPRFPIDCMGPVGRDADKDAANWASNFPGVGIMIIPGLDVNNFDSYINQASYRVRFVKKSGELFWSAIVDNIAYRYSIVSAMNNTAVSPFFVNKLYKFESSISILYKRTMYKRW